MSETITLPPLEAALLLGITPELLAAYTRNAPKRTAPERILRTVQVGGHTVFRREDLEQFDQFLREPWATPDAPRPSLPGYIASYLQVECGGQCARCGSGFPLENAHINAYAETHSHHHQNLIRLCATCHKEFDEGILSKGEIVRIKESLISKIKAELERRLAYQVPHARAVPVPTKHFVGRGHEVLELGEALASNRVISIQGPGGCGKTELLVQALSRYVDPREVIWIEVDGGTNFQTLEIALRAALGNTHVGLATALDHFGGYLIFDGVERVEEGGNAMFDGIVGELVDSTEKVRFVLTSQVRFVDLTVEYLLSLQPLSSEASRAILCAQWSSPRFDDYKALLALEQFAEGHPLTLRIANALLRHYESASIVLQRIAQHGAEAVTHPAGQASPKTSSLERCLALAFLALGADAKRLMYIASCLPAGFLQELAGFEEFEIEDAHAAIAGARRWNLLDEVWQSGTTRRLRALSPVRAFFRHQYGKESREQSSELMIHLARNISVQAVVIDHQYFSSGDLVTGVSRFSEELPNMLEMLDVAEKRSRVSPEYLEPLRMIAASLQVYCFVTGSSEQALRIMDIGLGAALRTGEAHSAGVMASHLLIHAQRLNRRDLQDRAIKTLRTLSAQGDDPRLAAQYAIAESTAARADFELEAAREWANIAVSHLRPQLDAAQAEDQQDLRHSLAMALMTLGRSCEKSRWWRPALLAYEEARELLLLDKDVLNLGAVLHQLGNCRAALDDYRGASHDYLTATKMFVSGHISEHIGNSLCELGFLLIKWDGIADEIAGEVSQDALQFGAHDVITSMQLVCERSMPSIDLQGSRHALRRLLGFCVLISLVGRESALIDICDAVRCEIIRPLADRFNAQESVKADEKMFVMFLDVSIAAAGNLARISNVNPARPSLETIGVVAELCLLVKACPPYGSRMFDWLAAYLRVRHRLTSVTVEELEAAAIRSRDLSQAFELPGYEHLSKQRDLAF